MAEKEKKEEKGSDTSPSKSAGKTAPVKKKTASKKKAATKKTHKKKAITKKKAATKKTASKKTATPKASKPKAAPAATAAKSEPVTSKPVVTKPEADNKTEKQQKVTEKLKNMGMMSDSNTSSAAAPAQKTESSLNLKIEFIFVALLVIFLVVFLAVFGGESDIQGADNGSQSSVVDTSHEDTAAQLPEVVPPIVTPAEVDTATEISGGTVTESDTQSMSTSSESPAEPVIAAPVISVFPEPAASTATQAATDQFQDQASSTDDVKMGISSQVDSTTSGVTEDYGSSYATEPTFPEFPPMAPMPPEDLMPANPQAPAFPPAAPSYERQPQPRLYRPYRQNQPQPYGNPGWRW